MSNPGKMTHTDGLLAIKAIVEDMQKDYPPHSLQWDALIVVTLAIDAAWYTLVQSYGRSNALVRQLKQFANDRQRPDRDLTLH